MSYFGTLSGVSRWVIVVFCRMTDGHVAEYFFEVSSRIIAIFWQLFHGEFFRYIYLKSGVELYRYVVLRLMDNIIDNFYAPQVELVWMFIIIKPTRCTNFSNLFLEWNSTCFGEFLCPSSGVFHCTHRKHVWHMPLLCVQWKPPDDGQRNCSKHVEIHFKNNYEKLVHPVGLIIRNISRFTITWTSN